MIQHTHLILFDIREMFVYLTFNDLLPIPDPLNDVLIKYLYSKLQTLLKAINLIIVR